MIRVIHQGCGEVVSVSEMTNKSTFFLIFNKLAHPCPFYIFFCFILFISSLSSIPINLPLRQIRNGALLCGTTLGGTG